MRTLKKLITRNMGFLFFDSEFFYVVDVVNNDADNVTKPDYIELNYHNYCPDCPPEDEDANMYPIGIFKVVQMHVVDDEGIFNIEMSEENLDCIRNDIKWRGEYKNILIFKLRNNKNIDILCREK